MKRRLLLAGLLAAGAGVAMADDNATFSLPPARAIPLL